MKLFAGTSRGVFQIDNGVCRSALESGAVRDLINHQGSVFAGTGDGLYVSVDEGASWQLAGLKGYEVWQVRAVNETVMYASTQPAALFRSDDGGTSWSEVESFSKTPEAAEWCVPVKPKLPGRARALVIDADDPNRIAVGVEVGGIMLSEDGGDSWQMVLPGENPDLHMMFAHPNHSGVLFASTGYGRLDGVAEMIEGNAGVFRSDDYGKSWSYAWKGITPRYSRPMCIDARDPYALTVASAPTAFSHYKEDGGAQAMLFRSQDEGRSWRSLCDAAHAPSAANFHGLTTDPDVIGGVVVGTDTGEVWQVSDDATWTSLASGMPSVMSLVAS
ncbi:MAG: hypothetical protein ACI8PT_000068 [Gammaproteobacteria bacterium]|jgi:hypothetical protein